MTRIEPEGADPFRLHVAHRDALPMWVVTARPSDFPDNFVARLWLSLPQPAVSTVAIVADRLGDLRAALPPGLCRLARAPADDPVIVEVWI